MSNKAFYIKQIDANTEMCMVIGWEDKEKYSIFYRNIHNRNMTLNLGLFESKEAWTIFNTAQEYTD